MFAFGKEKLERVLPMSPSACVARLEATVAPLLPLSIQVLPLPGEQYRLKLNSWKSDNKVTTVLDATLTSHPDGCQINGVYRRTLFGRIQTLVWLGAIAAIPGGMTVFLLYAALFAHWSKGGEFRFLLPLIPFAFTVGALFFLNHLRRLDPHPIERCLDLAFHSPQPMDAWKPDNPKIAS